MKKYCRHGHDTETTGRNKFGICKVCRWEQDSNRRLRKTNTISYLDWFSNLPRNRTHKKCGVCGNVKRLVEFSRDRSKADGRMSTCPECHRELQRNRRLLIRIKALAVLGGKCIVCGMDDPRVLEIDHINGGGLKEYREVGNVKFYQNVAEGRRSLDDLQLLCANHHRIKTYSEITGSNELLRGGTYEVMGK